MEAEGLVLDSVAGGSFSYVEAHAFHTLHVFMYVPS